MISLSMDNEQFFKSPLMGGTKKIFQGGPGFVLGKAVEIYGSVGPFPQQPAAAFGGGDLLSQGGVLVKNAPRSQPQRQGIRRSGRVSRLSQAVRGLAFPGLPWRGGAAAIPLIQNIPKIHRPIPQ
jgi:hypothetical protein